MVSAPLVIKKSGGIVLSRFFILALLLAGCGRYFPGPITPAAEDVQESNYSVQDDGTIVHTLNRLEVSLRAMTDEELNRQFADISKDGALSGNPYTFADWKPLGDTYTPPKYNVFLLKVKNYEYPKVKLDPLRLELVAPATRRRFPPLRQEEILEYYYSQAQAYAGNLYSVFQERRDQMIRTMFPPDEIFSGQELQGYVVFRALPPDVKAFEVRIFDLALRFDYKNDPVETTDLVFRFNREVFKGYQPPEDMAQK